MEGFSEEVIPELGFEGGACCYRWEKQVLLAEGPMKANVWKLPRGRLQWEQGPRQCKEAVSLCCAQGGAHRWDRE